MVLIGNIGVGLFVLIILWIIALIVFVVGIKFQSNNIAWISLGIAGIVTTVLIVIPLEEGNKVQDETYEEKDYAFIWSTLLLSCLITTAIIGFVVFFILHCIEPIHPKLVKEFVES